MAHISGHYTATFAPLGSGSATIGTTRDGFRLTERHHEEPIHTDDGGDTTMDAVHRGTDVEIELDYADYAAVQALMYSHTPIGGGIAAVGKLASALAGQLVLTAAVGSSAASFDGAKTWTFYLVKIMTDVPTLLANHVRQGPLHLKVYPSSSHSNAHYAYA